MRHMAVPVLVVLLAPPPAAAGVADFVAGCMAAAIDPARLPERLATSGWVERDPADGPPGPATAQGAPDRRLWALPGRSEGDAFIGLSAPGSDRPAWICWHVSRPGESAAVALPALQKRFPPLRQGKKGTEFFYGGYVRWPARVGRSEVTLGISWPMASQPEQGAALLSVAIPAPRGRDRRNGP